MNDDAKAARHATLRHAESAGRSGGLFATAVILARKGRYAEALAALFQAAKAGECSMATAWDLQARICAQQGLYLDAEHCWRKAQHLDPSNPAYAKGLARLRRDRNPAASVWPAFAMIGGLLLLSLFIWKAHVDKTAPDADGATNTDVCVSRLESEISSLRASVSAVQKQLGKTTISPQRPDQPDGRNRSESRKMESPPNIKGKALPPH